MIEPLTNTLEIFGSWRKLANMRCDLSDLYEKQKELDLEIANNHHISYETTHNKRILALLVEVGELANATRTFKFWSNKGPEEKERILDEYADGLHFLLSLGIDGGYVVSHLDVEDDDMPILTEAFLKMYDLAAKFYECQSQDNYYEMFKSYLRILFRLEYSWAEAKAAYYTKLEENHHRQETNY